MPQKKENKTKSHRKVPRKLIAEAAGASEIMVKMVLSGKRSNETDLGQRIEIAQMLLEEGINNLIEEVKRVVKI